MINSRLSFGRLILYWLCLSIYKSFEVMVQVICEQQAKSTGVVKKQLFMSKESSTCEIHDLSKQIKILRFCCMKETR